MQMWRFDCNQIKQPCNVHQMNIFTYKEHMQLQILLSNEQSRTLEGFNNNKKNHKNGKSEDSKHLFKILKFMYTTAKI